MQEFHEIFPFDDALFRVDFPIPTYSNVLDEYPKPSIEDYVNSNKEVSLSVDS